jgi:uncharacterized protein (TIGR02996 family)
MKPEQELFRTFWYSSGHKTLRQLYPHFDQSRVERTCENSAGSWHEFIGCRAHSEFYLETGYIDWLDEQGDCRGEFLRLLNTAEVLRSRGHKPPAWRLNRDNQRGPTEAAFLQSIEENRPGDEMTPFIFADWLEEQEDPRAAVIRCLARLKALSVGINLEWIEVVDLIPREWNPLAPAFPVTEQVRETFRMASYSAIQFPHQYVGTQHILIALVKQPKSIAGSVMRRCGVSPDMVIRTTEVLAPRGPDFLLMGKLPQSRRAALSLAFGEEEAQETGSGVLCPEHLLLGLCRASPCVATEVLKTLGLSCHSICELVIRALGRDFQQWFRCRPEIW